MAFKQGVPRPPNSGRRKGTKNKKTLLRVDQYLADQGVNPTQLILDLLPSLDPSDRLTAILELLKFCQPQLKPTDAPSAPPPQTPPVSQDVPTAALLSFVNNKPA